MESVVRHTLAEVHIEHCCCGCCCCCCCCCWSMFNHALYINLWVYGPMGMSMHINFQIFHWHLRRKCVLIKVRFNDLELYVLLGVIRCLHPSWCIFLFDTDCSQFVLGNHCSWRKHMKFDERRKPPCPVDPTVFSVLCVFSRKNIFLSSIHSIVWRYFTEMSSQRIYCYEQIWDKLEVLPILH